MRWIPVASNLGKRLSLPSIKRQTKRSPQDY
jgi:hypothetical protein